jgi:anti-sigma factor RsiW
MSVESFRKMPLDVRLSALLDIEVSAEEKAELERLLATDPKARETFDSLKRGSDRGRQAFEDAMKEPVPLALVRSIKNIPPPRKPVSLGPATRPSFLPIAPSGPQALAACMLLFVLGGGLGYLLGVQPGAPTSSLQMTAATTTAWLDDVAAAQRVYARQTRHLTEVPATEPQEIVSWLSSSTGAGFRIPDLTAAKLILQGGRLLVAGGKPTGQLLYRDPDGEIISVAFLKTTATGKDVNFNETIKDDIGLVSWQNGPVSYVVTGPSSDAALTAIAENIATQISN